VVSGSFNSAVLGSFVLSVGRERQPVELDGLEAGLAAAGPAFEDRLQ